MCIRDRSNEKPSTLLLGNKMVHHEIHSRRVNKFKLFNVGSLFDINKKSEQANPDYFNGSNYHSNVVETRDESELRGKESVLVPITKDPQFKLLTINKARTTYPLYGSLKQKVANKGNDPRILKMTRLKRIYVNSSQPTTRYTSSIDPDVPAISTARFLE
eukprot:TRINITY_DN21253_c0_g1_i1.p1 TRINITY_DN21253_c0_g1~~TRINITY_DN21253_c0_g1_i1.p1  ORF type:complete len:180 (-),score=45.24 TRINITY_DN21253_c0_g1_i1:105-584(-)